jgi:hypothetical protein
LARVVFNPRKLGREEKRRDEKRREEERKEAKRREEERSGEKIGVEKNKEEKREGEKRNGVIFQPLPFLFFPSPHSPHSPQPVQIINFGANPIRGVSGALGALGLPLGGATRGLPEQQFVKGTVYFFKSLNVENNSGFCWVGDGVREEEGW